MTEIISTNHVTSFHHNFHLSYDLTPEVLRVDFDQFQVKANKLDFRLIYISDLIKKKENEKGIPKSKVGLFLFMTHQL